MRDLLSYNIFISAEVLEEYIEAKKVVCMRHINVKTWSEKVTDLFGRQRQMEKQNSIQHTKVNTWSDRLIDRDNYWLTAVNMEDDGNLFDAVKFYLKDAIEGLNKDSLGKTALSCSCAATCLAKTGNSEQASALYRETAALYEENADSVIADSIRESLWSLEEAYEYYFVADDFDKAQIAYDKYMVLAKKINPLFGLEEQKETLEFRKFNAQAIKFNNRSLPKQQISSEVIRAMEELLQLRKSTNQNIRSSKYARSRTVTAVVDHHTGDRS
jgi:tetratricopeptide (TPR) repeat protein